MAIPKSFSLLTLSALAVSSFGQKVTVSWDKVQGVSKTTPTLQVVVNPPLRPGSAIVDRSLR